MEEELLCQENHVHDEICEQVNLDMPDENELYDVAELFKIFGDSTRIRILSALAQAEMCVCDIGAVLIAYSSASKTSQKQALRQGNLLQFR